MIIFAPYEADRDEHRQDNSLVPQVQGCQAVGVRLHPHTLDDESDVDLLVDFDEQHIDLLDYADNFFQVYS